jgi:hypothetical protein
MVCVVYNAGIVQGGGSRPPVLLCSPEDWAVKKADVGVKRNGSNEISEMCFWARTKGSSAYYVYWTALGWWW